MNLKQIFSIYGGYSILLGAAFIFIPAAAMKGAGIMPTADLNVTHQIWGAALVGIGIISFSLRSADSNKVLIGPAKAVMITCFLSIIVTLYHMSLGYSGPPIYMNIIIQGLAGVGILLKTK